MKDIVLGLMMTAPFVLGFFVAEGLGRFMGEDRADPGRRKTENKGQGGAAPGQKHNLLR